MVAATSILVSDIELAQVMTISYPSEPVVVRFDPAQNRYWLAYADSPETPIARQDNGDPYLVTLGAGRAASAAGVIVMPIGMASNTLAFNEQGGLVDFTSNPMVIVMLGAEVVQLFIAPATGTITEGAN